MTQDAAWLLDAHGVDCELYSSCLTGVMGMTLGHPLLVMFRELDVVAVTTTVGGLAVEGGGVGSLLLPSAGFLSSSGPGAAGWDSC